MYAPVAPPSGPQGLPHLAWRPDRAFHTSALCASALDSITLPYRLHRASPSSPLGCATGTQTSGLPPPCLLPAALHACFPPLCLLPASMPASCCSAWLFPATCCGLSRCACCACWDDLCKAPCNIADSNTRPCTPRIKHAAPCQVVQQHIRLQRSLPSCFKGQNLLSTCLAAHKMETVKILIVYLSCCVFISLHCVCTVTMNSSAMMYAKRGHGTCSCRPEAM